jgi:DNA-binding IclR family transcriptional regulator
MPQTPPLVRTLARGLDLLNALAESPDGLAVAELHRMVGLDMATIGRLIGTLEQYGYVTQIPDERKYRIGPRGLRLGQPALQHELLIAAANPELRRLRDELRETVSLFVRDGFSRICIRQLESPEPVRAAVDMSREYSVLSGATGLLLTAFAPPGMQETLLAQAPVDPLTEHTVVDRAEIGRLVDRARERGWAEAVDQQANDLSGIAGPVFDKGGIAIAAVAITGPKMRWSAERRKAAVPVMLAACQRIADRVRHRSTTAGAG